MPSVKPLLPPLKTLYTTKFPSELHDELTGNLNERTKREDAISTPITPPAAYTEFLKALSPVFSPHSAGAGAGTGTGVTFPKYVFEKPANSPTSQPASAVSGSFTFNDPVRSATASLPPPTPFTAPLPPRRDLASLRRLRIPQPVRYSPATEPPHSATILRSPWSPWSPVDWRLRYFDVPQSAGGIVSVRHVVTRTVTYKRTQLEDPPKGKRRKVKEDRDD